MNDSRNLPRGLNIKPAVVPAVHDVNVAVLVDRHVAGPSHLAGSRSRLADDLKYFALW